MTAHTAETYNDFCKPDSRIQLMSLTSVNALASRDAGLQVAKAEYPIISGLETADGPELRLKSITDQLQKGFRTSLKKLIRHMTGVSNRFSDNERAIIDIIKKSNMRIDEKYRNEFKKFMDNSMDDFAAGRTNIIEKLGAGKLDSLRFNEVQYLIGKAVNKEVEKNLSAKVDYWAAQTFDGLKMGNWALIGQKDCVVAIALLEQCFEFFGEMLRLWSYVDRGAWQAIKDFFTRMVIYDRKPLFDQFFYAKSFPNKKLREEVKAFLEHLAEVYSALTVLRDYDFDYMKMRDVEKHFLTVKQWDQFLTQLQLFHSRFYEISEETFDISEKVREPLGCLKGLFALLEGGENSTFVSLFTKRIGSEKENDETQRAIDNMWDYPQSRPGFKEDMKATELLNKLRAVKLDDTEGMKPFEADFIRKNSKSIQDLVNILERVAPMFRRRSYRGLFVRLTKAQKDDLLTHGGSDGQGNPNGIPAWADGGQKPKDGQNQDQNQKNVISEKQRNRILSEMDKKNYSKDDKNNVKRYIGWANKGSLHKNQFEQLNRILDDLGLGDWKVKVETQPQAASFGKDDGLVSLVQPLAAEVVSSRGANLLRAVMETAADGIVSRPTFITEKVNGLPLEDSYAWDGDDNPKSIQQGVDEWHKKVWKASLVELRQTLQDNLYERSEIHIDRWRWMRAAWDSLYKDFNSMMTRLQNDIDPNRHKLNLADAWNKLVEVMEDNIVEREDQLNETDPIEVAETPYEDLINGEIRTLLDELDRAAQLRRDDRRNEEQREDEQEQETRNDRNDNNQRNQNRDQNENWTGKIDWKKIAGQKPLSGIDESTEFLWDRYHRRVFGIVGPDSTYGAEPLGAQFTYDMDGRKDHVLVSFLSNSNKRRGPSDGEPKFAGDSQISNYRNKGNSLKMFRVDAEVVAELNKAANVLQDIMDSWENTDPGREVASLNRRHSSEAALFYSLDGDPFARRATPIIPAMESAAHVEMPPEVASIPVMPSVNLEAAQNACEAAKKEFSAQLDELRAALLAPIAETIGETARGPVMFRSKGGKGPGNIDLEEFRNQLNSWRGGGKKNFLFKNQRVVVSQLKEIRRIIAKIESMKIEESIQVFFKDWAKGELKRHDEDLEGLIDFVEDRLHTMEDAKFMLQQVIEEAAQLIEHITGLQKMMAHDDKFIEGNVMYEDRLGWSGNRRAALKLASADGREVTIPVMAGSAESANDNRIEIPVKPAEVDANAGIRRVESKIVSAA